MSENRIKQLFEKKSERVLTVYFTAGYPQLNDTMEVLSQLENSGADMVEIGIPYSDPVADGPTIQESNGVALENGISLGLIFDQIKDMRKSVSVPVVLMGYFNPILQFGLEEFCKKCQECGVDGVIIPDLPIVEYIEQYKALFEQYSLLNIYLITPQTSEKRIRMIDENTSGFIYMVSNSSITGAKSEISDNQLGYFQRIRNMNLRNPRLIGFGISDAKTFDIASEYSSGAIIGSAFIKALKGEGTIAEKTSSFIGEVKGIKQNL
ncbi:tryptophan synthase subunit alpha [Marinigracilibium pacificum]|uniref:Tryptophan synthase alpha chain n=1 Tax=Marinigracilibium pacificum TaxID=2729599 RepID=A0A848J5V5_9BACT|nr:tryptophan synthase subunit alpha [Marinigracilibium pacificum]NMM50628.1 tryptophan synthase subunit alpha [Marinigracilibium pacificum]